MTVEFQILSAMMAQMAEHSVETTGRKKIR